MRYNPPEDRVLWQESRFNDGKIKHEHGILHGTTLTRLNLQMDIMPVSVYSHGSINDVTYAIRPVLYSCLIHNMTAYLIMSELSVWLNTKLTEIHRDTLPVRDMSTKIHSYVCNK